MIVTVVWEDQRRGGPEKGFGPHALLLAAVADDLGLPRWRDLERVITANPRKGAGNVLRFAREDLRRVTDAGPVVLVLDRDKVRRLWADPPGDCMSRISARFCSDADGQCDLVFLVDNVESLVEAACRAMSRVTPEPKQLRARDAVLFEAADREREVRERVRSALPSFDRLVRTVASRRRGPSSA